MAVGAKKMPPNEKKGGKKEGKKAAPAAPAAPAAHAPERESAAPAIRPVSLDAFSGQKKILANLRVYLASARKRNAALDHVLFAGPPGLGKTTLARILARERGREIKLTSGPALQRPGDLAALLTGLQCFDMLFIDEIHRLPPVVEEILYPALEDFSLDIIIGEGPGARSVRIGLEPFTLIGATTRPGLLTHALRERFGIRARLDYYASAELEEILLRTAGRLGLSLEPDAARQVAARARGTPRTAQRLLARVRDFASAADAPAITAALAARALDRLAIDSAGLDEMDYRYLNCLTRNFAGRPTGVETLAAALGESRDTLEEAVEPYLLRRGLIARTRQGRIPCAPAYKTLGLPAPPDMPEGEEE